MAIDMHHGPPGHLVDGEGEDEDIEDGASDTSSILTEIDEDDIPSYFIEHDERLFHSHGNYPLPVDTAEQERLKSQHRTLHNVIGQYYVGPVDVVLAREPDRRKRVLDLGTGTGCWALDMADRFPSARFNAIDVVPIQTRRPPPNVHFEMHDITQRLRWAPATMDVVHARSIMLAVHDYGNFLSEVARVLRPGGILLAGEIEHGVEWSRPSNGAQGIDHFFTVVNDVLQGRGLVQNGMHIRDWLNHTHIDGRPAFTEIHTEQFRLPIGGWHSTDESERRLGRNWHDAMERYADSVKPMLLQASTDADVDQLVQEFKDDLGIDGMFSVYTAIWAIRAH